jgi:dihydropteroate synthase
VLGLPVEERLMGTAATVAIAIARGADIVRVHDVKEMAQVCRMADAVIRTPAEG